MYISMWDNMHSQKQRSKKEAENYENENEIIFGFLTESSQKKKDNK